MDPRKAIRLPPFSAAPQSETEMQIPAWYAWRRAGPISEVLGVILGVRVSVGGLLVDNGHRLTQIPLGFLKISARYVYRYVSASVKVSMVRKAVSRR